MREKEENTQRQGPGRPTQDGPRVNEQIRSPKIRLIDENGDMVGVVTPREGMERARSLGLDLVEISPGAEPPVCKILDYGRFKYDAQKKKAAAKKNQKIVEIKEVKLRPGIGEHDYQVKLRSIQRFINEGDRVKITMRFRGREITHQELGLKVLDRVSADVSEIAKVDQAPRLEGKQILMQLSPKA
ncbi:MAG: translation initiation factor IF-3 [Candidatus Puniceispirillum sp.]|nr:translation initiation factor IF-3 [Candidatus Puniceispirillum sp.]